MKRKSLKFKIAISCVVSLLTFSTVMGCTPTDPTTATTSASGDLTVSNASDDSFDLNWPEKTNPATGKKAKGYNVYIRKKSDDKSKRRLVKKVTDDKANHVQKVTRNADEKGVALVATVEALDDDDKSFGAFDVEVAAPTATATAAPDAEPSAAPDAEFVQVERLARPAINEGLIISKENLVLWNSVMPVVEADFLSGKSQAAKPIVDEATTVLKALGNTDEQVGALFKALLPDVMRIDTTKQSGYAGSAPGKLDNLTKDLRPVGGRMIKDDVIDITMSLIVPGGAPNEAPIAGLESDNVSYDGPNANGTKHKPVMSKFPYLADPN